MISYKVILAIFLSISFLIIAPLVVLYAAGYEITRPEDQLRPEFQVTGGLRVNPPRDYEAQLNQTPVKDTPFFTTGLAPGTVTLTLKQSGYQSWQKDLPIKEHRVTLVNAPILFPQNPNLDPVDTVSDTITNIISYPDTDRMLYVNQDPEQAGLWLFFPEEEIHRQIFSLPEDHDLSSRYDNLLWSQDTQNLFFTLSDEEETPYLISQVVTESQPTVINLNQEIPSGIQPLAIIGTKFFYQQDTTLFTKELSSVISDNSSPPSQATPLVDQVNTVFVKNNRIFYHSQANGGIYRYRLSSQEGERLFSSSPVDFFSLSPDSQYLFFSNRSGSFVFNLQEETLRRLPLNSITNLDYSSDRALIQTPSQISAFYLQDMESYITRSQGDIEMIYENDKIDQLQILKGFSEYAVFITDETLQAVEFDTRDHAQSFPLLEADSYHQHYDGEALVIYVHKDQSLHQFSFPLREGGIFN